MTKYRTLSDQQRGLLKVGKKLELLCVRRHPKATGVPEIKKATFRLPFDNISLSTILTRYLAFL
jgi:hypothetical protein